MVLKRLRRVAFVGWDVDEASLGRRKCCASNAVLKNCTEKIVWEHAVEETLYQTMLDNEMLHRKRLHRQMLHGNTTVKIM